MIMKLLNIFLLIIQINLKRFYSVILFLRNFSSNVFKKAKTFKRYKVNSSFFPLQMTYLIKTEIFFFKSVKLSFKKNKIDIFKSRISLNV